MLSAIAIPGVRSSETCTRRDSIPIRAAWRYSSRRCAEAGATASAASASASAAPVLLRDLLAVVISRIAVDGVNVIDIALRGVLDHQRRTLHTEIRDAARRRRAAPREIRLRQVGLY